MDSIHKRVLNVGRSFRSTGLGGEKSAKKRVACVKCLLERNM